MNWLPKILTITKRLLVIGSQYVNKQCQNLRYRKDIFQHYFPHNDEKIWEKCCRADFSSLWYPLGCWLWNGCLKQGFLEIYLTTWFAVRNFGNTSAIRMIFYFKLKIWGRFLEWSKKFRNSFLLLGKMYLNWLW